MFAGTQYFQPVKKLFKYNTTTYARVAEADITSYVYNLEVSDDDQFLYYSYQDKIYKASTQDLTLLDSIGGFYGINNMKLIGNGEAVCTDLTMIYKIDLTTGSRIDSIQSTYLMPGLNTNFNRSKIYATTGGQINDDLIIVDAASFSIDTVIALPGMNGDVVDAISTADGSQILVMSVGTTLSNGGLRVFNSSTFTQIYDVVHAGGGGRMTINANDEIWIPRQTSKIIMIYDPLTMSITDSIDFSVYSNAAPFKAIFTGVTTGVEEVQESELDVFPNPTTGLLRVDGVSHQTELELRGLDGRILKRWNGAHELSIDEFPAGCYLLELRDGNTRRHTRIVKQ